MLDNDNTSLCPPDTLEYSGRSCFGDTTLTQTFGRAVIVWATCHYRLSTPAPQTGGRDVPKCPEGSVVHPTTLVSSIASSPGHQPRHGIYVSGKFHSRIRALDRLPRCTVAQGPGRSQILSTVSTFPPRSQRLVSSDVVRRDLLISSTLLPHAEWPLRSIYPTHHPVAALDRGWPWLDCL